MPITRRKFVTFGAGSLALMAFGQLQATPEAAAKAIKEITGGKNIAQGLIELKAPEIAENGNSVPIEFTIPGATEVAILAEGNPDAVVAKFKFGKFSPVANASTRVRLSQTQNIIVLATMADGSFQSAQTNIKVTIGGCGG